MKNMFLEIINASIKAGKAICEIYNSDDFQITEKEDKSPLTKADLQSNLIINNILKKYNIPIISEENKQIPYDERKNWKKFWLVDPLDGTKEFIKKRGNFTVNIALIEYQRPIAGIIYIPHRKILYFGHNELGAFKIENINTELKNFDEFFEKCERLEAEKQNETVRIIASQSHFDEKTASYIEKLKKIYPSTKIVNIGSSLKFTLLAENKADIYPRFGPTMEWDIAAGDAILTASGGKVINIESKQEFTYNKENLLNKYFLSVNKFYTKEIENILHI